jgi:hypothetical protein
MEIPFLNAKWLYINKDIERKKMINANVIKKKTLSKFV